MDRTKKSVANRGWEKLTQENTVETMLEDEQKWCKVKEFIELIMKKKAKMN